MNNENEVSRKFETMLPLDVAKRFMAFARVYSKTGLGKFDYGVALRILLDRSDFYELYYDLINRIEMLEGKIKPKKYEDDEPITFRSKKEVNKNGQI